MLELLSLCTLQHATVRQIVAYGIDTFMVPHLSSTASRQRVALMHIVAETTLSSSPDQRSLPLCSKKGGALLTSALYKLCTTGGVADAHVEFVWACKAPSRVKFFAWLLVKGRVQCLANLLRKAILDRANSGCPICAAPLETFWPHHVWMPLRSQILGHRWSSCFT
jgi:hypothetical protein